MSKYLEAQAWVDESRAAMKLAEAAFVANPNDDTRWDLSVAINNWHRDLEIRMKRADAMTDEEYAQAMREKAARA